MATLKQYREQYINRNVQFVVIDLDGRVLESDRVFLAINPGDFIYDVHPFFASYASILETKEGSVTYNGVHLGVAGQNFITDVGMINKGNHILLVINDLTEHYTSLQKIAQARNESIINSELVVLKNLELEERERFKNAFIRNFSHELRNPLTSIVSMTNLLEKSQLDREQSQMVDFLKESNAHLKLLLEDIMSISMIASGKLILRHKVFNLISLLELIAFTYGSKTKGTPIRFDLDYDRRIPEYIEGDRIRIFQILTNLLDNALKFTEEGSITLKVSLNLKRANKVSLRFEVSDTGIGIPLEKTKAIFESFTQLEEEGKKEGAGLGLSIVKGLLGLMGSEVYVRSELGKGSSFYFDVTLTYALDLASKPLKKNKKELLDLRKPKSNKKYRVLLVEDDERTQMVLFKTLMDTDMFYIDLVNDGALVLETVINNPYDVILMDVDLPNVPGDQITRLIRDFPFKDIKKIPIIGVTANVFEEDMDAYLKMGMNAVVTKPFDFNELLEAIVKSLR